MIAIAVWVLCLGVSVPLLVLALECLAGSMVRRGRGPSSEAPPFTVLMPAHDEARVIARSVEAVRAQLRACDRLIVIADNCSDDTAAIAERLGATVVVRSDPDRRGKGHALEFGRRRVAATPGGIVIVVDADCSPRPDALHRLAAIAAERHAVVQGAYLLTPPPGATAMVRVSCFAFLVKNLVRQLAMQRLAGAALLQGSGMAFPYPVFERLDWRPASLVEDLELGLTLLIDGESVVFDAAALFVSDASSQQGTVGQRRRWEHGMLQAMARFVPRLLRAASGGRPRLLVIALDLLVPPTVLLIAMAVVTTAILVPLGGFSPPALILLASDVMLGVALFLAWAVHGRAILPMRSLGDVVRYAVWKLPILMQFLVRRERQWIRTEREP
jgi:cellulose synthase/poly-beta-1,6-N-acetylglucosamine synthase-like glycosyltransferase